LGRITLNQPKISYLRVEQLGGVPPDFHMIGCFGATPEIKSKDEIALADGCLAGHSNWKEVWEMFNKGYTASKIMKRILDVKPSND
jgi:hypothetical protein